jgi:scyllo-inositol 2-dehydrogenase (NADP+)
MGRLTKEGRMPDQPSDRPLRVAVIGYGLAGAAFHAPIIATTDGVTLAAIVTANPERAAAARDRYPGVKVVPDTDAVWRTPGEFDLVVVASPNRTHVPLALSAVSAGLPVVVDKPVAASVTDARRLRDAAERAGVLVSVFQNRRWDSSHRTLQQLLSDDALGTVHRFEAHFERWRPEVNRDAWREGDDPADAGGLLFDLGSHLVDQAIALFGPVARVYAEVRRLRPGALVDDDVFLALTHGSGTVSHLWASSTASDLGPWVRVLGSRASYVKVAGDNQEASLRAGLTPKDPEYGREPESAWGELGVPGDKRPYPSVPGAYQEYYAGIAQALRSGTPPPVTIDEAIATLSVIEAAQRSARDGVTVGL